MRSPDTVSEAEAREEMYAMMQSLNEEYDIDAPHRGKTSDFTMDVNAPDSHGNVSVDDVDGMYIPPKGKSFTQKQLMTKTGYFPKGTYAFQDEKPMKGDSRYMNMSQTYANRVNSPRQSSGDLLETRAHKFTERRPFQPMINKRNTTSKLSEFKYYTSPRKADPASKGAVTEETKVTANRPPPRPVSRNSQHNVMRTQRSMMYTGRTASSMTLMHETLMSRDLNHPDTPTDVPPLNISLDKDHMNWLQEQSKKSQMRTSFKGQKSMSFPQSGGTMNFGRTTTLRADSIDIQSQNPMMTMDNPMLNSYQGEGSSSMKEDLRYLDFITDVTKDVLDRGIFTDRALNGVFQMHVSKWKHELDVNLMQEMLDDLRIDLGIGKDGHERNKPTSFQKDAKLYSDPVPRGALSGLLSKPEPTLEDPDYRNDPLGATSQIQAYADTMTNAEQSDFENQSQNNNDFEKHSTSNMGDLDNNHNNVNRYVGNAVNEVKDTDDTQLVNEFEDYESSPRIVSNEVETSHAAPNHYDGDDKQSIASARYSDKYEDETARSNDDYTGRSNTSRRSSHHDEYDDRGTGRDTETARSKVDDHEVSSVWSSTSHVSIKKGSTLANDTGRSIVDEFEEMTTQSNTSRRSTKKDDDFATGSTFAKDTGHSMVDEYEEMTTQSNASRKSSKKDIEIDTGRDTETARSVGDDDDLDVRSNTSHKSNKHKEEIVTGRNTDTARSVDEEEDNPLLEYEKTLKDADDEDDNF